MELKPFIRQRLNSKLLQNSLGQFISIDKLHPSGLLCTSHVHQCISIVSLEIKILQQVYQCHVPNDVKEDDLISVFHLRSHFLFVCCKFVLAWE